MKIYVGPRPVKSKFTAYSEWQQVWLWLPKRSIRGIWLYGSAYVRKRRLWFDAKTVIMTLIEYGDIIDVLKSYEDN